MKEPIRIAINAQIPPNKGGGFERALVGLIAALGRLHDGPEEYIIIGPWQEPEWLEPYLGPNQRIVRGQRRSKQIVQKVTPLEPIKRAFGPLRPLFRKIWRELFPIPPVQPRKWPEVPVSDGFYENIGCAVIHFAFQDFVLCALPAIYNPHDLQHLHYPQFFAPSLIAWRETVYPTGCRLAHTVVVGSQWIRQDIVHHYGVPPEKVQVIPWAPYTQIYPQPKADEVTAVQVRYGLNHPFAFYPAMIHEHKNHLRLLEALAYLRDREGLVVHLVCTGNRNFPFWSRVEERLRSLNLNSQVQFLGMVPPEILRAIYQLAQFVIFPSLFEGGALPVFESWLEDTPLACSTATMIPEQAGDAALLFDPHCLPAITDAIRRMATDTSLRAGLIRKGQQRLQDFSWERTAKAYRAVYRRASRRSLTDEDRWLLSWNWMQKPTLPKENE